MKNIRIKKTFTDLKIAIENSNEAYGLTSYAPSELNRKRQAHNRNNVKLYYLDEEGNIWYKVSISSTKIVEGKGIVAFTDEILHKFSWVEMLHNGRAAVVTFLGENRLCMTDHKYERDQLRSKYLWTIAF